VLIHKLVLLIRQTRNIMLLMCVCITWPLVTLWYIYICTTVWVTHIVLSIYVQQCEWRALCCLYMYNSVSDAHCVVYICTAVWVTRIVLSIYIVGYYKSCHFIYTFIKQVSGELNAIFLDESDTGLLKCREYRWVNSSFREKSVHKKWYSQAQAGPFKITTDI